MSTQIAIRDTLGFGHTWDGQAHLYSLHPPAHVVDKQGVDHTVEHVVVQGFNLGHQSQTTIYAVYSNGRPLDSEQLEGSFVGDVNYARALMNLSGGYRPIDNVKMSHGRCVTCCNMAAVAALSVIDTGIPLTLESSNHLVTVSPH